MRTAKASARLKFSLFGRKKRARQRGVLESAVKTQLKSISAKIGAHGQAELIARIRRLP